MNVDQEGVDKHVCNIFTLYENGDVKTWRLLRKYIILFISV